MSTKQQQRMRGSFGNGNYGNGNGHRNANGYHHNNFYNNGNYHSNIIREEAEFRRFMEDGKDMEKTFMDLNNNMNERFRRYSQMEANIRKSHEDMKAMAEEKKEVAKMKAEVAAAQAKVEKDLKELRSEREQLERANTDKALLLAELKKLKRETDTKTTTSTNTQREGDSDTKSPLRELGIKHRERDPDDIPLAKRMKLSKKKKKNKDKSNSKLPIQIALQEDAPGLYEIMEAKGLTEGIDIIANVWEDDMQMEDDFSELGAIISKVWASTGLMRDSINKQRVQSTSACKPDYCLPCLSSLIDQSRIAKRNGKPVKWGWCRPLQSFIFVFETHNRIVLERPEYGYATYFFEIDGSHPVKWQVERLIKVMSSVCNCRGALLENRPLNVKELLPQELETMVRYGWTPDSGIGSLLNFSDRVLHDYKSEDEADWRSKIGTLLMDGLDQGTISKRVPNFDACTLPLALPSSLPSLVPSTSSLIGDANCCTLLARVKAEPC